MFIRLDFYRFSLLITLGIILLFSSTSCGGWRNAERSSSKDRVSPSASTLSPLPGADSIDFVIHSLEEKVKENPDDFVGYNKLAGYYLQRQRETGDISYLQLATRAAQASLKILPASQNRGGLAALAQSEYAAHEFAASREHAAQLKDLDPRKSYPYQLLGDALLELGDYDGATATYHELEQVERFPSVGTQTRLARFHLLRGETEAAMRRIMSARAMAAEQVPAERETIAWCHWQLGEIAFSVGDYENAERHYRDSLKTFPNYYRAMASLGRVLAARGDVAGALEQYEHVVLILPDPSFLSALGDLYHLSGRETEAKAQYDLVEKIGRLSELNGTLYNRNLAMFYADHEMKPDEAYAKAKREYDLRRDIYGADAVAWTALKAGKIREAQEFGKEALRLGTQDARLFYHYGLISIAAGDRAAGREYLQRALKLNPQFDPLQSRNARRQLNDVEAS